MSNLRGSVEEEEGGVDPWMLTYGDMVTLLLVFFVFLYAFSTLDVQKFREIVLSYRETLGILPSGIGVLEPGDFPQSGPSSGEPSPAHTLKQALPKVFTKKGEKDIEEVGSKPDAGDVEEERGKKTGGDKRTKKSSEIYTYLTEHGRAVMIPNITEFERGKYEVRDEFKDFLIKLDPLFEFYSDKEILVIGHADDRPLLSKRYPHNNWELGFARAIAVVDILTEELGIPQGQFTIESCSEYKKNQRLVDIIFRERPEYKKEAVGFR